MSVTGRIAVDVQFADATTSGGVQSLKTITLQDAAEYTSGKVAVLSGTVGTAAVTLEVAPTTYRDASGAFVSFAAVSAITGKVSRRCTVTDNADFSFAADGNKVFVTPLVSAPSYVHLSPSYTSGTAAYTLVLYGT